MKILVTGGAGFIGHYLVQALVKEGHSVRVMDDLSVGKESSLDSVKDKIELINGDICKYSDCVSASKDMEVIFHLAAQSSVPVSIENPELDSRINVLGTVNVLNSAVENKVKKVIFFSSAAVYGNPKEFPIKENSVLEPISPYGVSKLAGELYCKICSKVHNLQTIVFRTFNVYGTGSHGVIANFVDNAKQGKPLIVYGNGEQTRDFLHIEDVIQACLLALKTDKSLVLNIANSKETKVNDLAEILKELTRKDLEVKNEDERAGDISRSWTSIELAEKELGFKPKYDMKEGLKTLL
jgi:UDP-glucose 4-epimerase